MAWSWCIIRHSMLSSFFLAMCPGEGCIAEGGRDRIGGLLRIGDFVYSNQWHTSQLLLAVVVPSPRAPIFSDPRATLQHSLPVFAALVFTELFFSLRPATSAADSEGGHLCHTFLLLSPRILSLPGILLNQWRRAPGKKKQQYGSSDAKAAVVVQ
ncbi:hypothetical protein F5888DRAFT_1150070 [Russula emetica]|nr:hypothetical protein F5888DRAFT_1150070 [Russula emetica]